SCTRLVVHGPKPPRPTVGRELLLETLPPAVCQGTREARVAEEPPEPVGERGGRQRRWHEQPCAFVFDDLRNSTHATGDDRHSRRQRLGGDRRKNTRPR